MGKVIFFIIIITLVIIIIWLLRKDIKTNNQVNKNKLKRTEIDDLITQLREKIILSRQEAIDGKLNASEKLIEYELQLKATEELSKKYN